jgi:hypothetical protein
MAKSETSTIASLILPLHQRYEDAWQAYNHLDELKIVGFKEPSDMHACERAQGELTDETDQIRRLILRQVPRSDEELAVLAMHLSLYEADQELPLEDQKAIETGLSRCLDYLVREGRVSGERLGPQFSIVADLAQQQRACGEGRIAA